MFLKIYKTILIFANCTHFQYFGDEQSLNLKIPVYNPAVIIIERLK